MIGFVRALRMAALTAGALAVVLAAGWLDRVLEAGHFLVGLTVGFVVALGSVVAFIAYSHRQGDEESSGEGAADERRTRCVLRLERDGA